MDRRCASIGQEQLQSDTRRSRHGHWIMTARFNPYGVAGFGLVAVVAVAERWSLPEFCWSTWLAGLGYAVACVLTAVVQIILTARSAKEGYEAKLPFLRRVSPGLFVAGVAVVSIVVGLVALRVYTYLFGFYGLFLSVFSEMEPLELFGRNGFINSDFVTPVMVLAERFWPMVVAILLANWRDFVRSPPWKRLGAPADRELIRIHVMVIALPVLSLLAWAVFGDSYQPVTVVLLMAVLFLLPKRRAGSAVAIDEQPGEPAAIPQVRGPGRPAPR